MRYSEKDGVEVTYVCTTDLKASDNPVDIFFRETPHPEFGNRYFGIFYDIYRDHHYICNADYVEELEFGLVEDGDGNLHYSKSHHDFKYIPGLEDLFEVNNSGFIDGGREYCRVGGTPCPNVYWYEVKDGQMIEKKC